MSTRFGNPGRPDLVLGIETATDRSSVAILRGDRPLAERRLQAAAHGPGLIGEIERALAEAAVAIAEIEGFACGLGPGTFTGLRIGLATAKGFAFTFDRPLAGVPSLEALALRALPRAGGALVAPVLDARRGEVYAAVFDDRLRRVLAECVVPPDALAERLRSLDRETIACGGGAVLYADHLGVPVVDDEDLLAPSAREIVLCARTRWSDAPRGAAASTVAPFYVRPSDAELYAKR